MISEQPEAVKVAEPPGHIETPPPDTVGGFGIGFTVTVKPVEAGLAQVIGLVTVHVAV